MARLMDQDMTATQGFEKTPNSIMYVSPNDCPHCLKMFNEPNRQSNRVNVITNRYYGHWCAECADKGVEQGVCVKESKLSKEEKRQWLKIFKNV